MRHNWYMIAANFLLLAMLAALLFGVVSCQSYIPYEELEVLAQTDPKMAKKLERFERDAVRADSFIFLVSYCGTGTSQCYMSCVWRGTAPHSKRSKRSPERTEFVDLDEKVRWYRGVRHDCGFIQESGW